MFLCSLPVTQSAEGCLQIHLSLRGTLWPYLLDSEIYSPKLFLACYIIHHVFILKSVLKILWNKIGFCLSFKAQKTFSIKNSFILRIQTKSSFWLCLQHIALVSAWFSTGIGHLFEAKVIQIKVFYSSNILNAVIEKLSQSLFLTFMQFSN